MNQDARPRGSLTALLTAEQEMTKYRVGVNRRALWILAANWFLMVGAAYGFGSNMLFAAAAGLAILSVPALLHCFSSRPAAVAISQAIAAMCFSALLIHLGHGMIEMHFHVFVMLALMTLYASPWPVIAGAVTIAVHHISFFFWLPSSLWNHHCADFGIVLIHAAFVVAETVPCAFIARKFGCFVKAQQIASGELSRSTSELTAGAADVSAVSAMVEALAGQQSEALPELLSASETVQQLSARSTSSAADLLEATRRVTKSVADGDGQLKLLIQTIQKIAETSKNVSGITQTIDEIAFQTNILALNAAVEAARAGSSGAGFGVVADEVRALAQRSAEAARNTSALILGALNAANEGVAGLALLDDLFSGIRVNCGELSRSIATISEASREQSQKAVTVRELVERMHSAVGATHDQAVLGATAGRGLRNRAESLQSLVELTTTLTTGR
jgi:hypothetical protein